MEIGIDLPDYLQSGNSVMTLHKRTGVNERVVIESPPFGSNKKGIIGIT